jgi:hypothetical protein
MDALRRAGAPAEDVQVFRSFKHGELNVTFSDQCSGCQRWIHLGHVEHEGICFCGKVYRVVFDRTPEDWTMKQATARRCGVDGGAGGGGAANL